MMGREKHGSETNMVEVMLLHWYVECGHKCVTVNRYVRVNCEVHRAILCLDSAKC